MTLAGVCADEEACCLHTTQRSAAGRGACPATVGCRHMACLYSARMATIGEPYPAYRCRSLSLFCTPIIARAIAVIAERSIAQAARHARPIAYSTACAPAHGPTCGPMPCEPHGCDCEAFQSTVRGGGYGRAVRRTGAGPRRPADRMGRRQHGRRLAPMALCAAAGDLLDLADNGMPSPGDLPRGQGLAAASRFGRRGERSYDQPSAGTASTR